MTKPGGALMRAREVDERPGAARPMPDYAPGGLRAPRRLTGREIAVRYAGFALLAMLCNLGVQRLALAALGRGEPVAFGWAPDMLDWFLHDVLAVVRAGGGWRAELSGPLALSIAIACGTGAGLVLKYLLDKRWIFKDRSSGAAAHGRRFALYTLMGGSTTVIFWGMQTSCFMIWGTQTMLMIGGGLGLAIGYLVKYQLDKRFVFDRVAVRA